jgi:hypothetical protein
VRVSELGPAPRRGYSASLWTSMREVPTGRLCLQAYAPYGRADWVERWQESKQGDLQARLKTIARALEAGAPVIAKQVEEGERQAELERRRWEEAERQRRREEAARGRAEAVKASRADLAAIIDPGPRRSASRRSSRMPGGVPRAWRMGRRVPRSSAWSRPGDFSAAWMRSSGSGRGRPPRSASRSLPTSRPPSWGELATRQPYGGEYLYRLNDHDFVHYEQGRRDEKRRPQAPRQSRKDRFSNYAVSRT